MIKITLPNGAIKEYSAPISYNHLANDISPSLAKQVVVAKANGEFKDLQDTITADCSVEFFKAESSEGLEVLRHSCEHLLATAVCRLFAGAQVTMGPKDHSEEFYYDFDIGRPFTPQDLEKIESEITKLISEKVVFKKSVITKDEALSLFSKLQQRFKPEILGWIKDDTVSVYACADFVDLCRGPHLPHAGFIKAFKILSCSGAYWRADVNRDRLQRISGIAFAQAKDLQDYLHRMEEAKRRDHRKLGKELELFFVSEKFSSRAKDSDQTVLFSISGSVNAKNCCEHPSFLNAELIETLQNIFSPLSVRFNGQYFHPSLSLENAWEAQIKLVAPDFSSIQKEQIKKLENELNTHFSQGKISFLLQSRWNEEIGPGLVSWLPNGGRLRSIIEDFSRQMHFKGGYDIVYTPHVAKSDLWNISGHLSFYRENMFPPMVMDGQEYVLKPMNCPFHVLIYKNRTHSYRDLPLRLAEFGTVYRYEMAGVMHGLMRVRGFTQDDAHLFCAWEQIDQEIDSVIRFVLNMLKAFGFSEFEVNLATRPQKSVGDDDKWEIAENALKQAVLRYGLPYQIDQGGGAFYGPKIDIKLKDSLNRLWQLSTVQLDFNNPERFGLEYVTSEGVKKQPLMIHRALFGSIERFIGILIEHYAGAFPMWISPVQIHILPISERHLDYAYQLEKNLQNQGFRVWLNKGSDKLGAKIRDAQMKKIPMALVLGDKESEQQGASVRLYGEQDKGFMAYPDLLSYCKQMAQVPVFADEA